MARKNLREYSRNGNQFATILDVYLRDMGATDEEKIRTFYAGFHSHYEGMPYDYYKSHQEALAYYIEYSGDFPIYYDDIRDQLTAWGVKPLEDDNKMSERFFNVLAFRFQQIADYHGLKFIYKKDANKRVKVIEIS